VSRLPLLIGVALCAGFLAVSALASRGEAQPARVVHTDPHPHFEVDLPPCVPGCRIPSSGMGAHLG
jgi:hypothetical protein